jgi:hypothetical protein
MASVTDTRDILAGQQPADIGERKRVEIIMSGISSSTVRTQGVGRPYCRKKSCSMLISPLYSCISVDKYCTRVDR